jgi:hypothetical protein
VLGRMPHHHPQWTLVELWLYTCLQPSRGQDSAVLPRHVKLHLSMLSLQDVLLQLVFDVIVFAVMMLSLRN